MATLRKHAALVVLLLFVAPLMLSFADQNGIATVGDDSVSYLTLARHYAGSAGQFLAPWVTIQEHFPPLLPLALAVTGGADNLRIGHALVAGFAIAGIALVYAYGMLRFGRRGPALAVVAIFVATPSAWISIKGILSEPLFLLVSFAAVCLYEWRLARESRSRTAEWAVFGLLLGGAWLTRAAGSALVAGYALHALLRMVRDPLAPRWRLGLPLMVCVAAAGAWIATRTTTNGDEYHRYVGGLLQAWKDDPALMVGVSARVLANAWVATFAVSPDVSLGPRLLIALIGAFAIAGAIRRAIGNHLDGWYALAALGALSFYVVNENDTRRVLYPALPILLAHAAGVVMELSNRLPAPRQRKLLFAVAIAAPLLVCLPAMLLVVQRARDTTPFFPGGHAAADITDYYTTINTMRARAQAARQAVVLDGLAELKRATPPGARIMWIRPEYVAFLDERQAVPFYFGWNEHAFAEAIRSSQASHVVLATLFKSDWRGGHGDPLPLMKTADAYADRVLALKNAVTGEEEFVLLRVDPRRLDAYLSK